MDTYAILKKKETIQGFIHGNLYRAAYREKLFLIHSKKIVMKIWCRKCLS